MTRACIGGIAHYLPERVLSNEELAAQFEGWTPTKIAGKTGIRERHIAAAGETALDMAVSAGEQLFARGTVRRDEIDFVLLCTQSPEYPLPTSACLLQERLGLPTTTGALDFNLGCSGFVYGLSLAKGLVETGQARNVLLFTSETYSKLMHPEDRSVRTLFGDAAAVTLVRANDAADELIGPFEFGTDGRGAENLIVRTGGARERRRGSGAELEADADGNRRTRDDLYMNGREIFAFTLAAVPELVKKTIARAGLTTADVDLFVFHQANAFMLDHLRKRLEIPEERFVIDLASCGNTVSSTIPIALQAAAARGQLEPGHRVMVVGFGVGYSWAATLLRWTPS